MSRPTAPPSFQLSLFLILLLTGSLAAQGQVHTQIPNKTVPGTVASGRLGRHIATYGRDFWAVTSRTGADDVLRYFVEAGTGWTFKESGTFTPKSLLVGVDMDGTTVIRVVDNKVQVIRYTPTGAVSDHTDLAPVPADQVRSVAVDGNVAAYELEPPSIAGVGSVELFQWNGAQWNSLGSVTGAFPFGEGHIALEGEFLFVGVVQTDEGAFAGATGEVHVFKRSPGMTCGAPYCPYGPILKAPDEEAANLFGRDLAADGEWLAVGAPWDDYTGFIPGTSKEDAGIVYLYRFDGSSWVFADFVRFAGYDAFDELGWSVDLWNNSLVAGSWADDVEDEFTYIDAGSAHVFLWDGADWVEKSFLRGGNLTAEDWVGTDVSIGLYGVQVGAPGEDAGAPEGGAVHFFDNAVWLFMNGFESGNTSAWSGSSP